mgnify:CR=1 FL=1
MGWNECTDRKLMINQPGMFLFYCTTNGWWGLIVALIFAERITTHRLGVITYRSAFRRLMGQTRRRNEKHTIGNAWEKAWGKRNEWSLRNGNEYFPKPRGAEVYDWNESGMQYQGSA